MEMINNYSGRDTIMTSNRWVPWCICFAASLFFFYEFIQGNMFASIADEIMRDFHIEANNLTYLSSVYYLSNVLFLFVAGFILDRFSAKKTIVIAMLFCVISTFVLANVHTFSLAVICRFITGIGSAFCFLGPIRIASRWFPAKRMALITGLIVTIAMSGGMLAQYPLTKLVLNIGWRSAMIWLGWLGIFILGIMIVFIQDKPQAQNPTRTKISILDSAKIAYLNPQTLLAALYASFMNMAIAVFGAVMGSLYLMQRLELNKADASLINSMLFLGTIVGGPLMGWFSDKWGIRLAPMKVGAYSALLIVLAILYAPIGYSMMVCLFFLLGLFTASQVISYALVAESSDASITATAVSIVSILTQSGYVLYQNLFSFLLLKHGDMRMIGGVPTYSLHDYQFAAIMLPLGLILAIALLFGLRETYCRHTQG
jgi:MFS family permease